MVPVESASELVVDQLAAMPTALIYLFVWAIVFIGAGVLVGFFVVGSSLLFGSGLLAASSGSPIDMWVMTIGIFAACVLGNEFGYFTGVRLGRPYLVRKTGAKLHKQLERTERFYEKWGPFAVISARFIPWVRTFTPVIAGVARMNHVQFLLANVMGALAWGVGITVSGFFAGRLPIIEDIAYGIAIFFISATLLYPLGRMVVARVRR